KRSLLSLPLNAAQIQELPSENVETNTFGAARGLQNPALASYVVKFGRKTDRLALPQQKIDWFIPDTELDTMRRVAADLQVEGATPEQKVRAVERFFERDFRYTTYQTIS